MQMEMAVKGDTEAIIPDGNISISDRTGAVSLTGKTLAGEDPVCFIDIPEGDYNISIAVPADYNPTTELNYPLTLKAGDMATIGFGAQLKGQPQAWRRRPNLACDRRYHPGTGWGRDGYLSLAIGQTALIDQP